jgi:hypothetical protein
MTRLSTAIRSGPPMGGISLPAANTVFGSLFPRWLSDNRRLLVASEGKLFVIDSVSGKTHEVLSVSPTTRTARQRRSHAHRGTRRGGAKARQSQRSRPLNSQIPTVVTVAARASSFGHLEGLLCVTG